MAKKRTSLPTAAPAGKKTTFGDDDSGDDFVLPAKAAPVVNDADSDDDSDDDDAPEAVGMSSGREAERQREAAAAE